MSFGLCAVLSPNRLADESLRAHKPLEAPSIVHQHLGGEVHERLSMSHQVYFLHKGSSFLTVILSESVQERIPALELINPAQRVVIRLSHAMRTDLIAKLLTG